MAKKDVLGIWIEQNEGANFWMEVMNEVRNRGVQDILIAVVDGFEGVSGGDNGNLSANNCADVYCTSKSLQPVLLRLERPPDCGAGVAGYLPGRER
jgi:hypothetical protein